MKSKHASSPYRNWALLASIGVAGLIAFGLGVVVAFGNDVPYNREVSLAKSTPTATVTATVIAEPEPVPTPGPIVSARQLKPLAKLVSGDRILYTESSTHSRRLCTWVEWGGVIDFSVIECGGKQITVKTPFLTPVEFKSFP